MTEAYSTEKRQEIIELHAEGLSTHKAAKKAGVSQVFVSDVWRGEGLAPNYRFGHPEDYPNSRKGRLKLSLNVQAKICEAHNKGLGYILAGRYAGVDKNTIRKYWGIWGLKPHYQRGGPSYAKRQEHKHEAQNLCKIKHNLEDEAAPESKTWIAHWLNMSQRDAALFAGVGDGTIQRKWKKWGLIPHYTSLRELNEEQQEKLRYAHQQDMSTREAAEYAHTEKKIVSRYWRMWGLKPNFEPRIRNVSLTELLDNVFTKKREALSYNEILCKVAKGTPCVNEDALKEKIDFLVDTGSYIATKDGKYRRASYNKGIEEVLKQN